MSSASLPMCVKSTTNGWRRSLLKIRTPMRMRSCEPLRIPRNTAGRPGECAGCKYSTGITQQQQRFPSLPRELCFVCHSAFLRQCLSTIRAAQSARRRIRFCGGGFPVCGYADSHAATMKAEVLGASRRSLLTVTAAMRRRSELSWLERCLLRAIDSFVSASMLDQPMSQETFGWRNGLGRGRSVGLRTVCRSRSVCAHHPDYCRHRRVKWFPDLSRRLVRIKPVSRCR
jgi:hypothetical protein